MAIPDEPFYAGLFASYPEETLRWLHRFVAQARLAIENEGLSVQERAERAIQVVSDYLNGLVSAEDCQRVAGDCFNIRQQIDGKYLRQNPELAPASDHLKACAHLAYLPFVLDDKSAPWHACQVSQAIADVFLLLGGGESDKEGALRRQYEALSQLRHPFDGGRLRASLLTNPNAILLH